MQELPSLTSVLRQAAALEDVPRYNAASECADSAIGTRTSESKARRGNGSRSRLFVLPSLELYPMVAARLSAVQHVDNASTEHAQHAQLREMLTVVTRRAGTRRYRVGCAPDLYQTTNQNMVAKAKVRALNQSYGRQDNKHQPAAWEIQLAKCAMIALAVPHDNDKRACISLVSSKHGLVVLMNADISTPVLLWTLSAMLTSLCIHRGLPPRLDSRVSDRSYADAPPRRRALQTRRPDASEMAALSSTDRPKKAERHDRKHKRNHSMRDRKSQRPSLDHKRHRSETTVQVLTTRYWRNVHGILDAQCLLHQHLNSDYGTCKSLMSSTDAWRAIEMPATGDFAPTRLRERMIRTKQIARKPVVADVVEDLQTTKQHVNDLRRKKHRLEDIVRSAKEREDNMKSQLIRLAESKSRTERRLCETIEGKQKLQDEISSLILVNKKLAEHISLHHNRLHSVEEDQQDLAHRIEMLQLEREQLHAQLADSQRDNNTLRALDAWRHNEMQLRMRQAAAVENRLLAALDRFNALVIEHTVAKHESQELDTAHEESQDRLEFAQRMLQAVEESAEGQRVRIEFLESKEHSLLNDMDELVRRNKSLIIELDDAAEELALTKQSLDIMEAQVKTSRSALLQSQADAQQAGERMQQLTKELSASRQKEAQSKEQEELMRDELTRVSHEHAGLDIQLKQSNANLENARSECLRLEGIVDTHADDMRAAEASLETLGEKFGAFIEEAQMRFQQNEAERQRLTTARNMARSRLQAFEVAAQGLAEINMSLQHVVNSFEVRDATSGADQMPSQDLRSRSSLPAINGVEETDLVDDLNMLQTNMNRMHAILARIHMRRDGQFDRDKLRASISSSNISSRPTSTKSSARGVQSPTRSRSERHSTNRNLDDLPESPSENWTPLVKTGHVIEVPDGHKSWASLDSTLQASISTPVASLRRVTTDTPSMDPFVELETTEVHVESPASSRSTRTAAALSTVDIHDSSVLPDAKEAGETAVITEVSLENPFSINTTAVLAPIEEKLVHVPRRVDSMSSATALQSPTMACFDFNYVDAADESDTTISLQSALNEAPPHIPFATADASPSRPDSARFDGISRAKLRRLGMDVEAYHSLQTSNSSSSSSTTRASSVFRQLDLAAPASPARATTAAAAAAKRASSLTGVLSPKLGRSKSCKSISNSQQSAREAGACKSAVLMPVNVHELDGSGRRLVAREDSGVPASHRKSRIAKLLRR